jgi:hypothetical protein
MGVILGNRKTRHHAYSIDYYSNLIMTRALNASGNSINKLKINTKLN